MAIQTTSNLSNLVTKYYERKFLEVAQPQLVLAQFGKETNLPKNNGKQVEWRRFDRISSNTTPLTEGTPPSDTSLTVNVITATVLQYGDVAKFSDLLEFTAIDPIIDDAVELFGSAAAETIEDLIASELDSNASVQRVNNRSTDNDIVAGDVLSHKECIEAMVRMKAAYIKPHQKSGKYIVVVHPLCQYDLLADTSAGAFMDLSKYTESGRKNLLNGEIGQLYGMKFLESSKMPSAVNSGSISVKRSFVIGSEPFGIVKLNNEMFDVYIKQRGSGGTSDPLDQISSVGYKILGFATKYFGDASQPRVISIHSSASLG